MPADGRWDLTRHLKGYCMNLKKIGKVFMSKFVGTGPSSYAKKYYWAVVSQRWGNTALEYADTVKLLESLI